MKEKSEEGKIVFVSYAHEDDSLRNELEKHLSLLKQQHLIKTWHDQNISAGTEWEREIHTYLNKADIILLLISPDFMASRYCFSVEMERAMERHECGDAQVIPIIVRPVDWQSAPFGKLQVLPAGAKPIQSSQWHYVDEALFSVVEGIRKVIKASLWKEVEPHHTLFSLKGNEISNASPAAPLDQIQTQTFLNGTEKDFSVLQTRHESQSEGSQDQTLVADQQPVQEHDFYISYTRFDEQWAQWIASQLEDSGYTCYVKAWDLLPGHNYAWETDQAMKQAKRVIAVVSPIYLDTMAEWTAAQGQQLAPVIVQECTPRGRLGTLVSINLVGKDENAAKKILLHELALTSRKPALVTYPGASFPSKSVPANIPHPNAYFTGRTTELRQLHTQLEQQQRMAISGLGGIGKTQLALAYAHSHLATYDAVLWMNADNTAALNTSCNEIAELLHLPEASASEQKQIVAAVKRWLIKNRNYLLILDNNVC